MSSLFHGVQGYSSAAGLVINQAPAPRRKGGSQGHTPLLTDEQILEVRALSQFAEWGYDRLSSRYGVDKAMIHRVVSGVTRSRLVATLRHLPAGVTPI